MCEVRFHAPEGHHVLTTTARVLKAVALILDIMLSLRLCLRLTILADSLDPDLTRQNVYVFIDKTVRCAGRSANSLVSYSNVGVHTSTDVW